MWLKWLPWRYVVRRIARAHGFLDPLTVLSRLHGFAQPAEVAAPLELLRAGVVFHARGLMNTAAIQHNLDWVWPYWVERQFDPHDDAFIPRAFSITHVNLTHRNWTAVGLPDCDALPIVDPRGLVTPLWDAWSLDGWLVAEDGRQLIPSQAPAARQAWDFSDGLAVVTHTALRGLSLESRADVVAEHGSAVCRLALTASADAPAWLAVVLRPYNPEGVSFIHDVAVSDDGRTWQVNGEHLVELSEPGESQRLSDYSGSDVHRNLLTPTSQRRITCQVGMATAAALFRVDRDATRRIIVKVPLPPDDSHGPRVLAASAPASWSGLFARACRLRVPDPRCRFLYEAALRTLILHSPGDVFPGPYTYKRFWFRDAAFLINALLCAGFTDRVERVLKLFPSRQNRSGYFLSQEGEWDSNGEALWTLHRYCELTGRPPLPEWKRPIQLAARWIIRKRLPAEPPRPEAGLFPAGFSAEHLGPNDYYYWDDFWGTAGLRAAGDMLDMLGDRHGGGRCRREADDFLQAIDRSLSATAPGRDGPGVPASPYRRMDAGAIGSLAAGYPLGLWEATDPRLLATVEFLMEHCFFEGGFFQDMIHSGINAYLTLHVAQVLLRAGDPRGLDLLRTVAELASPTGQWPEAIHPRTRGGCMGDGHHAWASAEWLLAMRSLFVREEADRLVLAGGIAPEWLDQNESLFCGPTPTRFGPVSITIEPGGESVRVEWSGQWRASAPQIEIRLPGVAAVTPPRGQTSLVLQRAAAP